VGRVGIYEILQVNRTLRDLISSGATLDQLRRQASSEGFCTLAQQAIRMAEDGITSLDEILRVAVFD
jgi:type II secretory ATPase GspE/PulE/Tfp pilus assembly ATPase PilB-like protein